MMAFMERMEADQARLTEERDRLRDELHADRGRLEARIEADAENRARLEMDVAGLKSELDQEGARSADLKAEAEHQAREIDRLFADLARAQAAPRGVLRAILTLFRRK
jgi:chromosome segregation ATPase